jgi:hypothetical protein
MSKKNILISPPEELLNRTNLFNSLAKIYPVNFSSNVNEFNAFDAAIIWGKSNLVDKRILQRPCLFINSDNFTKTAKSISVKFEKCAELDKRLHNFAFYTSINNEYKPIQLTPNDIILTSHNRDALWVKRKSGSLYHDFLAFSPNELPENHRLWNHLTEDNILGFLPLIHFLREIVADISCAFPPLRASYIVDDPNIRCSTYGYINFPKLLQSAINHNYHVSFATIPLDLWWVSKSNIRFFQSNKKYFSLAIHGNNHIQYELHKNYDSQTRRMLLSQALKRVSTFEHKHGIIINRVMIPPHGMCAQQMVQEISKLDFDSILINRPFPWLPTIEASKNHKPENPEIISWYPADLVEGAFIISRQSSFKNIVLKLFLNRPVILLYHHQDFRKGYEILEERANFINNLGEVNWMSVGDIAFSNYACQITGTTMKLQMFSKRIMINKPENINQIVIEIPPGQGRRIGSFKLTIGNSHFKIFPNEFGYSSQPIPVPNSSKLMITLQTEDYCDYKTVTSPGLSVWSAMRRILTETRDRVEPKWQLTNYYEPN